MNDKKALLLDYLTARGISDPCYLGLLEHGLPHTQYRLSNANGYDFMFSRLFDESDDVGYGLIPSNENLHTEKECQVAIGLVEGDDIICIDLKDGSINLWLVENGNGEHIPLAPDFSTFWKMIT